MAKKSAEQKIDALTSIVEKGFAKHGKEIHDLTESVTHVVKHMLTKEDGEKLATKDQVYSLQTQVNSIEQQLRKTRAEVRLGNLEEKVSVLPAGNSRDGSRQQQASPTRTPRHPAWLAKIHQLATH